MTTVIAEVLLALGVAVIAASSLGVAVLEDPMHRLHLVTPAALIGVPLVAASVVVSDGFGPSGLAAIAVALISVVGSPLLSQALARSVEVRRRAEGDR